MRKKMLFAVFSMIVIFAIAVSPVGAITGNWVEDFDHPYVGLVAFYDASGEFVWRCSGSLISSTKFLTAGHCADTGDGAVTARVWFQQDAGAVRPGHASRPGNWLSGLLRRRHLRNFMRHFR